MDAKLPPLSLYVHVPWCIRKCPYCDFNSHQVRDEIPESLYLDRLISELKNEQHLTSGRPIHSIFIGGGTPSLLKPESYARLLEAVKSNYSLEPDAEITMEANPGTFEQEKFEGFADAGINRLSIGVQSFDDDRLRALGRIHTGGEAVKAIQSATKLFQRTNIDLMHGLPGQTPDAALNDLEQAIAFEPDQISWYQLTIEPNTEFAAKPPSLPIEEFLWAIQEQGSELLKRHGYEQYEISAFARPGGESKHNLNYWQFGDYLGIGAGAHAKISRWEQGQLLIERIHKQRQPKAYINAIDPVAGREIIESEALPFEFMLNALRLKSGVATELFEQSTGCSIERIEPLLSKARQRGMLVEDLTRIAPTQEGQLFLNDLLEMFID
ncbi:MULTISPECIES: radical SAM family heme chaperone HemW [unclassified Marinobacterium]|uniref:radical SAM family heme chaperone HemW n=1 Tax=unclassified Marinobacterium TaxID=2644139 RepID=UPI00156A4BC8|nr:MULTISPECIES: radical SAM family heme chaperone HemW [unclassified Marinobacterium]NRP08969.1 Oxygen-independent coproporphyrinogen-III oxidase 1 [Marinobacterium sp. xm-g-48]NRP82500.1 Oxygen-independent coproporphyrinogen-III oxidase 1 [Marinobacterium sp. xm-d-509]